MAALMDFLGILIGFNLYCNKINANAVEWFIILTSIYFIFMCIVIKGTSELRVQNAEHADDLKTER